MLYREHSVDPAAPIEHFSDTLRERIRLTAERNGARRRGRWLPSSAPSQNGTDIRVRLRQVPPVIAGRVNSRKHCDLMRSAL